MSSQPLTEDDVPVVVDKLINFVTDNGMTTANLNYKLHLAFTVISILATIQSVLHIFCHRLPVVSTTL